MKWLVGIWLAVACLSAAMALPKTRADAVITCQMAADGDYCVPGTAHRLR